MDLQDDFHLMLSCLSQEPSSNRSLSNCTETVEGKALGAGQLFYMYATPVIFAIGTVGNVISLRIFTSKHFRSQAGGVYLASLSAADLLVLFFYVLLEWLKRGWPLFSSGRQSGPVINADGFCQAFLYFSYASRFLSSWFVVAFTVERYIGVCHPFCRLKWCTTTAAKKAIVGLTAVSMALSSFKPALSGTYVLMGAGGVAHCTGNPDHQYLSFILDSCFAVSISFVPFFIIAVLNGFIIRSLLHLRRRQQINQVKSKENTGRTDFTFLLLIISFCFIAMKLPFFVTWCLQFFYFRHIHVLSILDGGKLDDLQEILAVTRAVFYLNYGTNFFLYSFVGSSFRRALRRVVHGSCLKTTDRSWTARQTYARATTTEFSNIEMFKKPGADQSEDNV